MLQKKQYYLYIENSNEIDLTKIKKRNKFVIIYRNNYKKNKFNELFYFRRDCKRKSIKFFVANNLKLASKLNADGIYISSFNKRRIYNNRLAVIGSAHNYKEICEKKNQGCKAIIFSRLFKTDYNNKKGYLGVVKFNLTKNFYNIVPLGGIRIGNLNKLKIVNCNSFAVLSELKKKPAKLFSRLF